MKGRNSLCYDFVVGGGVVIVGRMGGRASGRAGWIMGWNGMGRSLSSPLSHPPSLPRFAALPLCPLYERKARSARVRSRRPNGYVAIASNKANLATEVLYLIGARRPGTPSA